MITFQNNDGGRAAAGYTGSTGDCVTRAIAIASGRPYQEIYDRLAEGNATQRKTKRSGRNTGKRTAAHGIITQRLWFKEYMKSLGFKWVSVMGIGTGCTTHLKADELPQGRPVVSVSKHYAAVIDGVLHDTHDCSRGGTRCVYGYWIFNAVQQTAEPETVRCTWCARPTSMLGTKHCDRCHELETRITLDPAIAADILRSLGW